MVLVLEIVAVKQVPSRVAGPPHDQVHFLTGPTPRRFSSTTRLPAGGREAQDETFEQAAGSAERFPVYGMLWGRVDSPWIFSIQADDRENRDALLAAFVTAAKSSPR